MSTFFSDKVTKLESSISFDDILIKPAYSNVLPTETEVSLTLSNGIVMKVPVFSAAMDTVTGYEMARAMAASGGCGPLHKNTTVEENIESLKKLKEEFGNEKPICVSVGVSNTHDEIKRLIEAGANTVMIDCAHGHSENVGVLTKWISENFPDVYLIAGNVVTKEGAEFLISRGAKAVKVGMGCGSTCTTRKVTGVGRGQISSIVEVADYCKDKGIMVIADGGIRSNDEIMKAIACGADAVMMGYMFSGCDECPGEIVEMDGEKYKYYR
ncbi:inosine-5'-monophosphate dehydrogenase-like, partial [Rattus rattus]|uniref:inosine-5'-monophosphate dehydrogenase-like n=1 Tax=Rattus rattus TaxID=10117 RepID=UPI0013F30440